MIQRSMKLFLTLICASLAVVSSALAQSVSSSVDAVVAGAPSSDTTALTSAADAESFLEPAGSSTMDLGRQGYGHAVQNRDGVGAVSCEGVFSNADPSNSIVSHTYWTDSATNTTASPITYEFSYEIAPPRLRLYDHTGVSDATAGAPEVSFVLEIRANGVVVFSSSATMVGGTAGHNLTESGSSLNPVAVSISPYIFGYDFDPSIGTINLGSFNPGESVTVEYEMTTSMSTAGVETGGRAAVGDPFDLGGSPGFSGTFTGNGTVPTTETSFGGIKASY